MHTVSQLYVSDTALYLIISEGLSEENILLHTFIIVKDVMNLSERDSPILITSYTSHIILVMQSYCEDIQ